MKLELSNGAVLGATVAGIDKSKQDHDYVAMCEAWFNAKSGPKLVLNNQGGGTGGSFWYELFPNVVFYALADRHPEKTRLADIVRITADRWREALRELVRAGPEGTTELVGAFLQVRDPEARRAFIDLALAIVRSQTPSGQD